MFEKPESFLTHVSEHNTFIQLVEQLVSSSKAVHANPFETAHFEVIQLLKQQVVKLEGHYSIHNKEWVSVIKGLEESINASSEGIYHSRFMYHLGQAVILMKILSMGQKKPMLIRLFD